MTREEQLIHVSKNSVNLTRALLTLETAGLDVHSLRTDLNGLRHELETYVPPSYPERYRIRSTPIDITEHLTGNRDLIPALLHAPTSQGRIYTLTKGQRTILRERYGMTPTTEVKLLELAVWPAAPTCVQHVVISSTEHVPDTRKHVLNRAVIDDWVTFCEASEAIDKEVDLVKEDEKQTKKSISHESFNDLLSQYL